MGPSNGRALAPERRAGSLVEGLNMNIRLVSCAMLAIFLAVLSLVFLPALVAQNGAPSTKPCIGCSVDGKTTPRTADGHPDLSGFWNNKGNGHLYSRADDGSLLFD